MASTADGDLGETLEQMRGLWPGVEDLSLNKLATSLGASEQALRLIFSIFLGKDPPACLCPLVESLGNRQNGDWGQDLSICPNLGPRRAWGCGSSSTPASYRRKDKSGLESGGPYSLNLFPFPLAHAMPFGSSVTSRLVIDMPDSALATYVCLWLSRVRLWP